VLVAWANSYGFINDVMSWQKERGISDDNISTYVLKVPHTGVSKTIQNYVTSFMEDP